MKDLVVIVRESEVTIIIESTSFIKIFIFNEYGFIKWNYETFKVIIINQLL